MVKLLPCFVFTENWANELRICVCVCGNIKGCRKMKLTIMHFFFITKIQGLGLHYIMLMLANGYSCLLKMLLYVSPRCVWKDRMDTFVMKGSLIISVFLSLPLQPLTVRSNNDFCLEKLARKKLRSHHENNDHFQPLYFGGGGAVFIIMHQWC